MANDNNTLFPIGTQEITYTATDLCDNSETCSFDVTILPFVPGGGEPCESSSDFPWHEWISNVQLNNIDNASSKKDYSDFTDISTNLSPNVSYDITLVTGYSWESFDEYWKVWIDYNQNGILEEPTETAFSGVTSAPPNGTETATISGTVSVPASALPGAALMRVSMKRGAAPTPCETLPFGEVEDYTGNY